MLRPLSPVSAAGEQFGPVLAPGPLMLPPLTIESVSTSSPAWGSEAVDRQTFPPLARFVVAVAVLPAMVALCTLTFAMNVAIPPPRASSPVALLPAIVLLLMVTVPRLKTARPPPRPLVRKGGKPTTLLPLMVLSVMVTSDEMKAPRAPTKTPPPSGAMLLPAPFVLSRTVTRARARWPTLLMPPPFLTVRSDSSAEHRLSGRVLHEAAQLRWPPAIAVLRAPAPS